jgi:hypothetical protein
MNKIDLKFTSRLLDKTLFSPNTLNSNKNQQQTCLDPTQGPDPGRRSPGDPDLDLQQGGKKGLDPEKLAPKKSCTRLLSAIYHRM